MDLRPSPTWTSRFLLVSIRKVRRSGWTSAASCFLVDESRLSRVTCQVNWPWSWARWAVGSRRCCWQPWEKCSGYQGMLSGTGQFTVLPLKSLHDHRMITLMSRWSFILQGSFAAMGLDYLSSNTFLKEGERSSFSIFWIQFSFLLE